MLLKGPQLLSMMKKMMNIKVFSKSLLKRNTRNHPDGVNPPNVVVAVREAESKSVVQLNIYFMRNISVLFNSVISFLFFEKILTSLY